MYTKFSKFKTLKKYNIYKDVYFVPGAVHFHKKSPTFADKMYQK